MRLINTETYQFKESWNENSLVYAILSHRWEDDEVSFQDFLEIQGVHDLAEISRSRVAQKKGFQKIEACCMQAKYDKIKYVWIDTCCIDKTSSAELTEAINSMYRWYRHSKDCYAFLSDVSCKVTDESSTGSFSLSSWFTRGWTLQELVAPHSVIFYDRSWEWLGTKHTLSPRISQVTGIDEEILHGKDIMTQSIAQRMSWASKRVTTRMEDIAYSLLGIFDVNMPLLYGEGHKAFLRLQEEIIRSSDDHTIFAWPHQRNNEPGLLAQTPAAFESCGGVRTIGSRTGNSSYSMTNRGLSISLDAKPWSTDTYLVALKCVDERLYKGHGLIEQQRMAMFLRRLDEDDQYIRVQEGDSTFIQCNASAWDDILITAENHNIRAARKIDIHVRQKIIGSNTSCFKQRLHGFRLNVPDLLDRDKHGKALYTVDAQRFDPDRSTMTMRHGCYDTVGLIDASKQGKKIKAIKLGFDFDYNPVCFIAESRGLEQTIPFQDRQGHFTAGGGGSQWMYSAAEKIEFKGIRQRNCFDTAGWSPLTSESTHPNQTTQVIALQLRHHPGLWAIKGDRVHGLRAFLGPGALNAMSLLEIRRAEVAGKLVWDVNISGIRDSLALNLKLSLPTWKKAEADVKNSDDRSVSYRKSVHRSVAK